jgi:hypothetical protein
MKSGGGTNEFRKLVDCYVMNAIGALDTSTAMLLQQMTPRLQEIYDHQGSWDEIVRHVLDLPVGIESRILELWNANKEKAASVGVTLSPKEFAVAFVDKHITGQSPDGG